MGSGKLRVKFLALWSVLTLAKLLLAWRLPLFVDEAFYAWEGRHPAWAYSDLPGLTAWLTRLGAELGGATPLAIRAPFLLIGAIVPWWVVRIARRWFGEEAAWQAGLLALLMPLAGWLGVLALPDVPLVLASLLCLDGIGSCRERLRWPGLLTLACGLVLGAFAHYRFALVLVAGLAGLSLDPRSRALLRAPRFWLVLAVGALAWLPLLAWNHANADAGLRFQLIERNPWRFHADGAWWLAIQCLLLTPPLFLLLVATLREGWRRRREPGDTPWPLLCGVATVSVVGYFLLGFFADRERVSFHWPLAGWLVLAIAAPLLLCRWRPWQRRLLHAVAALGLLATGAVLATAAVPAWRESMAASRAYPDGFAGWQDIADALRRASPPAGTRIVADNFELAAQLAFALRRDDIGVLDHPLNHKHGRAAQLRAWGAIFDPRARRHGQSLWLVVEDNATPMKARLAAYHARCAAFGVLPVPEVVMADHGRKRFLVYRIGNGAAGAGCAAPALAWIDAPHPDASLPRRFMVRGWAFKDGAGLARIEVTIDGAAAADASYGTAMPHVREYWRISTDPAQPDVGFSASVDATSLPPGRHWLGLRLYGRDGSVEPWPEQAIRISR